MLGLFGNRGTGLGISENRYVPQQMLLRLVKEEQEEGGSFGPEEIGIMTTAFEGILSDLNLVDRNDPVVTMVAKLVVELVRNGERDPLVVRKHVLGLHRPAP